MPLPRVSSDAELSEALLHILVANSWVPGRRLVSARQAWAILLVDSACAIVPPEARSPSRSALQKRAQQRSIFLRTPRTQDLSGRRVSLCPVALGERRCWDGVPPTAKQLEQARRVWRSHHRLTSGAPQGPKETSGLVRWGILVNEGMGEREGEGR